MLLSSAPRDLDTDRSQTVKEMHVKGPRVQDDTAEQSRDILPIHNGL